MEGLGIPKQAGPGGLGAERLASRVPALPSHQKVLGAHGRPRAWSDPASAETKSQCVWTSYCPRVHCTITEKPFHSKETMEYFIVMQIKWKEGE